MNGSESNDLILDIINMIEHKNILLAYQESTPVPEVLCGVISAILMKRTMPLIWVCWKEPASAVKKRLEISGCGMKGAYFIDTVGKTGDAHTILQAPKDFSGMFISIQKIIKNKECILVLDRLDFLGAIKNKEVFANFLSSLLTKSKKCGGIVLTSIKIDFFEPDTLKTLLSLYDSVFYIGDDEIRIEGDIGRSDVFYEIQNNKLLLRPVPKADITRIKDSFNISFEELDQLDKIIEKNMDEYKDFT